MNDTFIKEIIGPTDKLFPVGIVTIEDNTHKIIFKGKNMVVAGGRNYIYSLFKKMNVHLFSSVDGSETLPTLDQIRFGSGSDETKFTDTSLTAEIEDLRVSLSSKKPSESDVDNHHVLVFENSVKLSSDLLDGDTAISEIGLFLSNGTMFSRIVIDSIPLGVETEFIIKYALYF